MLYRRQGSIKFEENGGNKNPRRNKMIVANFISFIQEPFAVVSLFWLSTYHKNNGYVVKSQQWLNIIKCNERDQWHNNIIIFKKFGFYNIIFMQLLKTSLDMFI